MKVALLAKDVYPSRGGVELHVHNLAIELARLGHDVHVFVSAGAPADLRPNRHWVTTGVTPWKLYQRLRQEEFTVVHAHGARTPFTAAGLLAGRPSARAQYSRHTVFIPRTIGRDILSAASLTLRLAGQPSIIRTT